MNKRDDMVFDFGENRKEYSEKALNNIKIKEAEKDFLHFFRDITLDGKSFLDIGFGQGLSLLIAAKNGAKVCGVDINKKNKILCLENNAQFFHLQISEKQLHTASILD